MAAILRHRIELVLRLPLASLDRMSLPQRLTAIGTSGARSAERIGSVEGVWALDDPQLAHMHDQHTSGVETSALVVLMGYRLVRSLDTPFSIYATCSIRSVVTPCYRRPDGHLER